MKFGSLTYGLGDTVLLTAICKYFPNEFTVQLPPDKSRFSVLFDHLAKVEICDESEIRPLAESADGHFSTRKLKCIFGSIAETMDNRPLVLHSNYKSEKWAHQFLKDKPNPIIFAPNCSKEHSSIRSIPDENVNNILKSLRDTGNTPIICQVSSNYRKFEGIELVDIDLKDYICLLRQAGVYAGANTGDEHLAVGVGCQTIVYQPLTCDEFNSSEWNYIHPNCSYYTWQQMNKS